MITVDRYHDISAGHRVAGHENKCAHLHGHNYRITFTVADTEVRNADGLDTLGRVVDFSVIKEKLCDWLEECWDHKMLIWNKDPMREKIYAADPGGVTLVPFNPTAENMAKYLVEIVAPMVLPDHLSLVRCRVEETRKCAATYEAEWTRD